MQSSIRRNASILALAVVSTALAMGVARALQNHPPDSVPAAALCFTSPPAARASVDEAPDARISAVVPADDPPPGSVSPASSRVAQGSVVRIEVTSERKGAVAVHGLMDVTSLHEQTPTRVAFRAIYSGRFPLHFHGADGSHIEIAALEVMPRKGETPRSQ